MSNLDMAKRVIKENFANGAYGIFNTVNIVGDYMTNLYSEDGLQIDICYSYEYFEVFGLTDEEFKELKKYYSTLKVEDEGE